MYILLVFVVHIAILHSPTPPSPFFRRPSLVGSCACFCIAAASSSTVCFAGRGGNRSGGAVCLLHHLSPLLHRCFVLDCSIRRPWKQPLWWDRVPALPPEPSASPLLRPRLFDSQAVEATALVPPYETSTKCHTNTNADIKFKKAKSNKQKARTRNYVLPTYTFYILHVGPST
jgi:hypothetical protein